MRSVLLVIFLCVSNVATADGVQAGWGLNMDTGVIYRQDKMNWHIGNAPTTTLSELEYKMKAVQPKLALNVTAPYSLALQIYYANGDIKTGEAFDSDYDEQFSTLYLLSKSNVIGGMKDFGGMFSKEYSIQNMNASIDVGWSRHQQSLTMIDGFQLLPDEAPYYGAIGGLNNHYNTQWQGFFWGAGLSVINGVDWLFKVNVKQYFLNYKAKADWNLRKEFSHPLSFEHQINANAYEGSITAVYRINKKCNLKTFITLLSAEGNNGSDVTYFDDGSSQVYFLNQVNWQSTQYGMVLDFKY